LGKAWREYHVPSYSVLLGEKAAEVSSMSGCRLDGAFTSDADGALVGSGSEFFPLEEMSVSLPSSFYVPLGIRGPSEWWM
jgi:hypothetical protein